MRHSLELIGIRESIHWNKSQAVYKSRIKISEMNKRICVAERNEIMSREKKREQNHIAFAKIREKQSIFYGLFNFLSLCASVYAVRVIHRVSRIKTQ